MIALVIAATALPVVGILIVGLDVIPIRFAMMHVALLGIAVGLWTGLDPLLCGLALCGLVGAGLAPLAEHGQSLSGAAGFVMTVAIALALVVLSVAGVNANGAYALLWGSILATRTIDVVLIAVVCSATLVFYAARRRSIALLLFDREIAACSGVRVGALTLAVLVIVAVATASAVKLTGALLVDAVTLLPALAARNLATSLGSAVGMAIAFGLGGNLVGFFLALALDQPPGPVMVLTAGAVTVATYLKRSSA
ncbi:MAG: metal ABC transporter permease [Thermoleophilia bacterium]